MSSGSSVFSINPPKTARMERFILVQTPISAQPPTAKCENLTDGTATSKSANPAAQLSFVRRIRSGSFNSSETGSEYSSSAERLQKRLGNPRLCARRATDVGPELHSGPTHLLQCAITKLQSSTQGFARCRQP